MYILHYIGLYNQVLSNIEMQQNSWKSLNTLKPDLHYQGNISLIINIDKYTIINEIMSQ